MNFESVAGQMTLIPNRKYVLSQSQLHKLGPVRSLLEKERERQDAEKEREAVDELSDVEQTVKVRQLPVVVLPLVGKEVVQRHIEETQTIFSTIFVHSSVCQQFSLAVEKLSFTMTLATTMNVHMTITEIFAKFRHLLCLSGLSDTVGPTSIYSTENLIEAIELDLVLSRCSASGVPVVELPRFARGKKSDGKIQQTLLSTKSLLNVVSSLKLPEKESFGPPFFFSLHIPVALLKVRQVVFDEQQQRSIVEGKFASYVLFVQQYQALVNRDFQLRYNWIVYQSETRHYLHLYFVEGLVGAQQETLIRHENEGRRNIESAVDDFTEKARLVVEQTQLIVLSLFHRAHVVAEEEHQRLELNKARTWSINAITQLAVFHTQFGQLHNFALHLEEQYRWACLREFHLSCSQL